MVRRLDMHKTQGIEHLYATIGWQVLNLRKVSTQNHNAKRLG